MAKKNKSFGTESQGEKQDKQGHAITPELRDYLAELERDREAAAGGWNNEHQTYFERFRNKGE